MSQTVKWSETGEPYLPLPNAYTLTPIRETDASQWVELKNHPTMARWRLFDLDDLTLEKAQKHISESCANQSEAIKALKAGQRARLTPFQVIRSPSGDVVGTSVMTDPFEDVSFIEEEERHHFLHPNIGWSLLPEHTGRGIASAAARVIIGYCRDHIEDPVIAGGCHMANKPSIAMFERLGFDQVYTYRGPLSEHTYFEGYWWTLRLR